MELSTLVEVSIQGAGRRRSQAQVECRGESCKRLATATVAVPGGWLA